MKKYRFNNTAKLTTLLLVLASSGVVLENSSAAPSSFSPAVKAYSPSSPKAPQCGPGFKVMNKKLHTKGGKSWYSYTCESKENIYRICNQGLSVLNPKNKFINLAGTPQQVNSVLKMNYTCAKPEG